MALVFKTENFIVEAPEKPHVDRNDGGHIKIYPKIRLLDRQKLSSKEAIELMRLTIIVGEAMNKIMNEHGVDIGRINYQDNGNWTVFSPQGSYLHIHLYGRAKSAKIHEYGQACFFPHREEKPEYYKKFKPLNKDDIKAIKEEIDTLLKKKEYQNSNWGLF